MREQPIGEAVEEDERAQVIAYHRVTHTPQLTPC